MIETEGLIKQYGSITAVDNISFQVGKGEILGFLGPNGAGKSTTMKMLTCFITPTSGTAKICGKDILTDSLAVREQVGYLPESAPLYKNMMVKEFLEFIASIRGFSGKEIQTKVNKVVETTELDSVLLQTIDTLSKGYRQRVCFAQALIHDPPVLILDEPTDGLDPNQKQAMRKLIKNMSKEKTILLSTHILEEVEAVCTRAIIINKGKIVVDGTPEELLKRSTQYNTVNLLLDADPPESLLAGLRSLEGVKEVTQTKNTALPTDYSLTVVPQQGSDILDPVRTLITDHQSGIREIYRGRGRMDEVFRILTQQ